MNDDTRLDLWMDKHPRIDRIYTKLWLEFWTRVRRVQQFFDFAERRDFARWKPGITYLDHGYEPCALIEKDEYGGLTGVSMVDGRVIGGCSIYHCGPERVSLKEARAVAETIKKMRST